MPVRISPSSRELTIHLILSLLTILTTCQLEITSLTATNYTLGASTQYTFGLFRYGFTPVLLGSSLTFTFDNAYAPLIANPTCTSSNFGNSTLNCNFLGTRLTVNNLFSSSAFTSIQSFSIKVTGIRNPSPAKGYTPVSQFEITSPSGTTLQSGTSAKIITILPLAAQCSYDLLDGFVFARGQLSISFTSTYIEGNSNSSYYLNVRMNSYYPADSTQTLVNPLITPSVVSTQPIGSQYIYSLEYVTALAITMLMPPSTQSQSSFITLSSYDKANEGQIDSCSISLSGVQPNSFTQMTISQGTVQTITSLQFNLRLSTPLMNSDSLRILFPSSFSLGSYGSGSSVSVAGYGSFPVAKLGNQLILTASLGATVLNSNLIFTISSIGMPFTSSSVPIEVSLLTFDSYYRINQTLSYSPRPGLLTLRLTCLNYQIGSSTTCSFTVTTASSLSSDATIVIALPSSFPVSSSSSTCALSGNSLVSSTTCLYSSTFSTIQVTTMNRTISDISPLTFTLNVSMIMSQLVGNFSLALSTTSSGNIVDTGTVTISATSRQLTSTELRLISSSSTTNTPTIYTLLLNLPFDLGYTYTLILYLPVSQRPSLTVSVSNATLISYGNSTLVLTAGGLTNSLITLGNLLTPISLEPIVATISISYQGQLMFEGSQQLAMSNMRTITTFTLSQSNKIVYSAFTATIVMSDLAIGDQIHLSSTVGSYFYQFIYSNCSTEVVCASGAVLTVSSIGNAGSGLTSFQLTLFNLPYVGSYTVTATVYDSLGIYGKQTGTLTLSTTTPNTIRYSANQTNPYLNEATTYTFVVNFTTPNATFLTVIPSGFTVISAQCILNCNNPSFTSGYLFPITSVYAVISLSTTNPQEFSSLAKFTFTTSNAQGTKDTAQYIPQLVCALPCRSCPTNNASQCLTCYSWMLQKYLSANTCLTSCQVGTYPSSSLTCSSCPSTCASCSSATNCISCKSTYFLSAGQCILTCPANALTVAANFSCEPCSSPCGSCSISIFNCTGCVSSFYLLNNSCVSACPDGYYRPVIGSSCLLCNSSCLTCSASQCLTCPLLQYLFKGICYTTCPGGSFANSTICEVCPSTCSTCTSLSTCLSCVQGHYLSPNTTCNAFCPNGYYPDTSSRRCTSCDISCTLCNATGCLSCSNPNLYLQSQACVPTCSSPFYPNNQTMTCQNCVSPCSACSIWSNVCASCIGGYSLLNQACLQVCPGGYYSDGNICHTCSVLCQTCSFVNLQQSCNSCRNNSYIYSYSCVETCPNDTQVSGQYCTSNNCPSLDNCFVCSGYRCLQCGSLYTLSPITYSCTQQATANEVLAALSQIPVPFPFLIAILMVIVLSFFLKHAFPKMFSPLFIYSLAGALEELCLVMWTSLALLWNANIAFPSSFVSAVYATVLVLLAYFTLNVVQLVCWKCKIASDRQYKLWEKQDNRFASLLIAILALLFSYRLDALKFSRTGHSPRLSARLSSPDLFRHYTVLAVFGMFINACSILVSVYISSLQSEANYLFFSCLEVAIVSVLMIILSIVMLCIPKEQLIEDKGEYKYGHDEDNLEGPSLQEALAVEEEYHSNGEVCSNSGSAVMRKQSHSEQASQDITLQAPDKLSHMDGNDGFVFDEETGQQACSRPPRDLQKVSEEDLFGVSEQADSDSHILIDEIEEHKFAAISMAQQFLGRQAQTAPLFSRQAGSIAKQKLQELPGEIESQESNFGDFEEYSLNYKTRNWNRTQKKEQKQTSQLPAEQSAVAEDIVEARRALQKQIEAEESQKEKARAMKIAAQRRIEEQSALQRKIEAQQRKRREREAKQKQFKQQIDNIAQLNLMLSLMAQQQNQLENLTTQLAKQEIELRQREQQLLREKRQRMLMAIEDNLSSMAAVVEAVQTSTKVHDLSRRPRKIPQQNQTRTRPQSIVPLKYSINQQENLPKQLSPTKIKISPQPHPSQYKRQHIFLEEGISILSQGQQPDQDQLDQEMEIVFEERSKDIIARGKEVEKPKSIVRKQTAKKRKEQKPTHNHSQQKPFNLKSSLTSEQSSKRLQVSGPVLVEQMEQALAPIHYQHFPKDYRDESEIEDATLPRASPEAQEQGVGETQNLELPEDLEQFEQLEAIEMPQNAMQIQETDEQVYSSRQTHWPIEPELNQRILEVERRANAYISAPHQPKRTVADNYRVEAPADDIYEEEQESDTEEDWQGKTVNEIVFGEEDKIIGVQELMRSDTKKRFRVARANRRVIDLSPN